MAVSIYEKTPVAEEDIPKTAFCCHRDLFEFTRMPFGLCNAPSKVQRTMDYVLAGAIGKHAYVYLDDIVIYSKSVSERVKHLADIFEWLRQAGLRLKPSKCHFGKQELLIIGYIVNKDGISCDPDKPKAISQLPQPQNVKELRSVLGMANYYRQCVPDYASIAQPLVTLTKKHQYFCCGPDQTISFNTLKQMLMASSVMAFPRTDRPYKLYTDVCDYAIGAIHVQVDDTGVERVIQYYSHQLSGAQLHWVTVEKEAYAIVKAIEKQRPYLHVAKSLL